MSYYKGMDAQRFRQSLVDAATPAERRLCQVLDASKWRDRYIFQHQIGRYFVDFYFPERRLCVEVDGGSHDPVWKRVIDHSRTEWLKAHEYAVLRVPNQQVWHNAESIVRKIMTRSGRRCSKRRTVRFIRDMVPAETLKGLRGVRRKRKSAQREAARSKDTGVTHSPRSGPRRRQRKRKVTARARWTPATVPA